MTERPLLLQGWGVLATLQGRKTQTRRIVSPHNSLVDGGPWPRGWEFDLTTARVDKGPSPSGNPGPYLHAPRVGADTVHRIYPRYFPGDLLWVRETWAMSGHNRVEYKAFPADGTDFRCVSRWRPSIHMPRLFSRIILRILDVRVQRVQEITREDAIAEGIDCDGGDDAHRNRTTLENFAGLWDSINAKRAPWESNPFVWVISFRRVE